MKHAIFLDRDNTIVKCDTDSGDPKQVYLIRGAAHAIASLRLLGYRIVVIANEGAVARGIYTEADVDALHQRIAQKAHESAGAIIDRFYFCPFHPEGTVEEYRREHPWRKPSPGMILQAALDLDLNLKESWMVGDSERDIQAGLAAGCQTILVETHAQEQDSSKAHYKVETLAEAAAVIAQHRVRPEVGQIAHVVSKNKSAPIIEIVEIKSQQISPNESQVDSATDKITIKTHVEADREQQAEVTTNQPREKVRNDPTIEIPGNAENKDTNQKTTNYDNYSKTDRNTPDNENTEHQATKQKNQPEPVPENSSDDPEEITKKKENATKSQLNEPRKLHMPMPAVQSEDDSAAQTEERRTRLLMDVLSEIRSWRTNAREFTPFRLFAFVAMALILLGAVASAIYIEGDRGVAWIGVMIVAQLTVIGLLLVLPNG